MKRKGRLARSLTRIPILLGVAGSAILLHGGSRAEAEPQPNPAVVQNFLAELERREAAAGGEADRKAGETRRIRNIVEGAAKRAPSEPMVNRIEKMMSARLG